MSDPAALFKRSLSETGAFESKEPVFRVRIPVENRRQDFYLRGQEKSSFSKSLGRVRSRALSKRVSHSNFHDYVALFLFYFV